MTTKQRRRLRFRLHVMQAGLCSICRKPIDMNERNHHADGYATFDHKTPRSRGGANGASNLTLAHQQCNVWRGNMHWHQVEYHNATTHTAVKRR